MFPGTTVLISMSMSAQGTDKTKPASDKPASDKIKSGVGQYVIFT